MVVVGVPLHYGRGSSDCTDARQDRADRIPRRRDAKGVDLGPSRRAVQSRRAHQFCLAHLITDAQYAIDDGDTVFAPAFKAFLKRACKIGGRRPGLTDSTIKVYARAPDRELDDLRKIKPPNGEGRHLRDAMIVEGDKLLVSRRAAMLSRPTTPVSSRDGRLSSTGR